MKLLADRDLTVPRRGSRRLRRLLLIVAVSVVAVRCGGSGGKSSTHSSKASPGVQATTKPTTLAADKQATAGNLGGTWSGVYYGAYAGTFTLSLQKTGPATFSGTIELTSPVETLTVNGFSDHVYIEFGTVGPTATTYTGAITDGTMSGTYEFTVTDDTTETGPFTAVKAS